MKSDVSFTLRLPFSLKQDLFDAAKDEDETAAIITIWALREYLKKRKK